MKPTGGPRVLKSYGNVIMVLAVFLLFSLSANADLVVSVGSTAASAGSTGNALDVNLTNTGAGAVMIGGFSFELVSSSSDISFTQANISTASPYIFDGLGLFGPVISTTTGQTLDASDAFSVAGSGTTLGSGVTVGLGHVLFNVSSNTTPQSIAITLTGFPATSLVDVNGGNVPITSLSNGAIRVTGSAVPEPSSMLLLGSGLAGFAGMIRRKLNR